MSVSRRQLRVAIVIGVVVGIVAVPVLGSVLSGFIATSGTVPVSTNTGATIYVSGASDLAGTEWTFDNTVEIRTDQGNLTVTGNDQSSATVQAGDITGTYTNLTSLDVQNATTFDPEDKAELTIDGDATDVAWRDYAADDGTVDTVIAGPDGTVSNLTYYGLSADTTYSAVNASTGTPLDVATTNSNGQVTFTINHSEKSILLQSGDQSETPTQSNASPTGELTSPPDELSVDVADGDFPDDTVDVTFELDGSEIDSQSIDSNQTVSTSLPSDGQTGGEHTWTVTATDRFNNTNETTYTYTVPSEITFVNESNTSELVDDPINITVRFIYDGEVTQRETNTGTLDLSGLPLNTEFVVTARPSENYSERVVYFEEGDIYEQTTVYLLNTSAKESIQSRFILNDPTGTYDPQSLLTISKPITENNTTTFKKIHSDRFGVEGVTATLESDERYRVSIRTDDGSDVQDLGPYRSAASETVEIQPSAPGVSFTNQTQTFGYGAELDNRSLTWSYYDTNNETDSLTIWIHERGNKSNKLAANETYLNLGNASGQLTLTENESKKEWAVNFVVERNGDQRTYQTLVRNQARLFPEMLDDGYRQMIGVGALLLLAGALSVLNVGVGAVVFGISGGLLWWTGWLGGVTSGVAVAMYMFVAVMVYMYKGGSY